jgi:hypothetical protein
MSKPEHISQILVRIAADKKDDFGKVLRRCPFMQAELIRRGIISLDDLTDEEIETLIEWDVSENGLPSCENTKKE